MSQSNGVMISSQANNLLSADSNKHIWIFAYGSLLWRPNFDYMEQQECYVTNYMRYFHQSSEDHRGTSIYPGRVVTLEPTNDSSIRCRGLVYLIHASQLNDALGYLNERECGGYELTTVNAYFDTPRSVDGHNEHVTSVEALIYMATHSNPYYAGYETIDVLAERIARSSGASGPNSEYLFKLYEWLHERNYVEPHIVDLYNRVKHIIEQQNNKDINHETSN